MNPYQFQLEDFALSDGGIHLLRSGFNYKTVSYDEIKRATIGRSNDIKNTPVILAIGVLLILFAFYQGRWVIGLFTDPTVHHIYIESIVLPVIPALFGVYCIYMAVKKKPILKLEAAKNTYKLRLRSVIKKGQYAEFEKYLNLRLQSRLHIDPNYRH
jgi:hypothetical protein